MDHWGWRVAVAPLAGFALLGGVIIASPHPFSSFFGRAFGLAVAGFIGGLILMGTGFVDYIRYDRIRNTPRSTVRALAMGPVEVRGTVNPREILKAPFSGRECVAVYWGVEQKKRMGKTKWTPVDAGADTAQFLLDDGTGAVRVDPWDASLGVEEWTQVVEADETAPEPIARFAAGNGTVTLAGRTYRFTEKIIRPGEEVYVLGVAQQDEEGTVIADTDRVPFTISDMAENRMQRMLRWDAAVQVLGGALLAVWMFASLLGMTGLL